MNGIIFCTERDAISVISALNKFIYYFNELPLKAITDHSVLTKFMNGKGLSARTVRWSLKLSQYNTRY